MTMDSSGLSSKRGVSVVGEGRPVLQAAVSPFHIVARVKSDNIQHLIPADYRRVLRALGLDVRVFMSLLCHNVGRPWGKGSKSIVSLGVHVVLGGLHLLQAVEADSGIDAFA